MYTAKKPIKLSGKTYYIGEEIPTDEIDPGRVKTLMQYGCIEFAPESPQTALTTTSGTNTHRETKEADRAVKQQLNSTGKPAARKPAAKKGGK